MIQSISADSARIRAAWQGRISGCLLGKPLEVLSFREGRDGLSRYLERAGAMPLSNYVPLLAGTIVEKTGKKCCAGYIVRAEPDDDLDYTLLALHLLEQHGAALATEDVARAWLKLLPGGATWTAERAAYRTLLNRMDDEFVNGEDPGFDLGECSDNDYNEWIGAQIRADIYGWVCPGRPEFAAELATRDAMLSHRGEGVNGAAFIAALGAAIPTTADLDDAMQVALQCIPASSDAADAVRFGTQLGDASNAVDQLHRKYGGLSPVHTLNNLAVVTWALHTFQSDFTAAICNAVMAGWDTDCNGATVGGLMGLRGAQLDMSWTRPWNSRIKSNLAGVGETTVDKVVERTLTVAKRLKTEEIENHV
jgi:ADP-ribosylglycohydrolase